MWLQSFGVPIATTHAQSFRRPVRSLHGLGFGQVRVCIRCRFWPQKWLSIFIRVLWEYCLSHQKKMQMLIDLCITSHLVLAYTRLECKNKHLVIIAYNSLQYLIQQNMLNIYDILYYYCVNLTQRVMLTDCPHSCSCIQISRKCIKPYV